MTTATKAKTAKKSPAKTKAKSEAQKDLAIAATAAPGQLLMVPIELIDTLPQVRKEFDEERIAELAADISARGILQPVLLREGVDGRYIMIAGERRMRAARLAGLPALPAIVGIADERTARAMQLAENIQREELTLNELAKAVRAMFDNLGNLQAVADACRKSKPWASKHLALSEDDFTYDAKRLLEDGSCEDIETLLAVSHLAKMNWHESKILCDQIRKGEAGRTEARERLKAEKDKRDEKNQEKTRAKLESANALANQAWPLQQENDQADRPKQAPDDDHYENTPRQVEFMSWEYMQEINRMMDEGEIEDLIGRIQEMSPNERQSFEASPKAFFNRYQTLAKTHSATALLMTSAQDEATNLELASAIWGIKLAQFDLIEIIKSSKGYTEAVDALEKLLDEESDA